MTFPISRKIAVVSDCEVILAVQRNENLCTRKSFSIMRGVSWEDRCLSGRQPPHKNNAMRCDNAYAREITGRAAAARPVRRIRKCAKKYAILICRRLQHVRFTDSLLDAAARPASRIRMCAKKYAILIYRRLQHVRFTDSLLAAAARPVRRIRMCAKKYAILTFRRLAVH